MSVTLFWRAKIAIKYRFLFDKKLKIYSSLGNYNVIDAIRFRNLCN